MPSGSPRRSPLAVAVLALLYEAPMHPYRMQQLIKDRGKGEVVNVRQRASIYQTIDRLLRDGLIAVRETGRDENWPERTTYELTADGRAALTKWMRDMLSTPSREFPDFPAAVSFISLLEPADALIRLEARITALEGELARIEAGIAGAGFLPRLFILEDEYRVAVLRAELSWVRATADDLRAGRITWDEQWLRSIAARFEPGSRPATLLQPANQPGPQPPADGGRSTPAPGGSKPHT